MFVPVLLPLTLFLRLKISPIIIIIIAILVGGRAGRSDLHLRREVGALGPDLGPPLGRVPQGQPRRRNPLLLHREQVRARCEAMKNKKRRDVDNELFASGAVLRCPVAVTVFVFVCFKACSSKLIFSFLLFHVCFIFPARAA